MARFNDFLCAVQVNHSINLSDVVLKQPSFLLKKQSDVVRGNHNSLGVIEVIVMMTINPKQFALSKVKSLDLAIDATYVLLDSPPQDGVI